MSATAAAEVLGGLSQGGARDTCPVAKLRYSHEAMIEQLIANPAISQNQLAALFGYTPGWVSRIITSDAFQALLAQRRKEVVHPELTRTIEERFRGVTTQALTVLEEKLEKPNVSDQTVLKALELGAKALGVGGNAPPAAPSEDRLVRLAERLYALQSPPPVAPALSLKETEYHEVEITGETLRMSRGEGAAESGRAEAHAGQPAAGTIRADGSGADSAARPDGWGRVGE